MVAGQGDSTKPLRPPGIAFNQINRYMYADDAPESGDRSALPDDLIRQAVFDRSLRPAIEPAVIADFESRVQRTRQGYVPRRREGTAGVDEGARVDPRP